MEIISGVEKYMDYAFTISTLLFIISEGLAHIPSVKANSIFQAIYHMIKNFSLFFAKKPIQYDNQENDDAGKGNG